MTETDRSTVLVADDQRDVRRALRMLLEDAGFRVVSADSPAATLAALRDERPDLLLMDLNYARDTTSGDEGVALLREVRALDEHLPVIVMTAFGTVDVAVRVMREGASDFIEKPWDNRRVLSVVSAQLEISRARRREAALTASLASGDGATVIGASAAMRGVFDLVERVGGSDATVLVTGENGVGKGVIARALHRASPRADRALLTVDMGTLSGGVVEAELFGNERGAFTDARRERIGRFELADGGTLLLDEIANCPPDQQPKLLRVIESGEFERLGSSRTRHTDVRVICATNSDLRAEVEAGRFRRDLLFRINTIEIHVPPLRDRLDDVAPLARHFLTRHAARYRRDGIQLGDDALAALRAYPWPGNVRELDHALERAVLLARDDTIAAEDLRLDDAHAAAGRGERPDPADALDGLTLEDAERLLVRRALDRADGNVKVAAERLGISRSALYRRLDRLGVDGGTGSS